MSKTITARPAPATTSRTLDSGLESRSGFIRRWRALVTGALVVVAGSLGLLASTAGSAQATDHQDPYPVRGCPAYYICIYAENAGWNHNYPQILLPFRGKNQHYTFNLKGMYGKHRVFNNGLYIYGCGTTWDETLTLNTGYNGAGSHRWIQAGKSYDIDLTPYNSVTLNYVYQPNNTTC